MFSEYYKICEGRIGSDWSKMDEVCTKIHEKLILLKQYSHDSVENKICGLHRLSMPHCVFAKYSVEKIANTVVCDFVQGLDQPIIAAGKVLIWQENFTYIFEIHFLPK